MAGLRATSFFEALKEQKIPTRPAWKTRKTNPWYGYAWLSGEIVMNPVEYKNVLRILELSTKGKRPHQIARFLDEKGILPRRGKMWYGRTIADIIDREKFCDRYGAE